MSEQMFSQLKHLIGHLPKSKLLAGAALSDGKFKFYLSGKKPGRINEAISNKDAVIMGDGGVANIAYAEGVYSYSSHNFGFFSEKESVETQYIYRALENFLPVIDYKGFVGSGIKNIDKSFLFDLYLQIPPLPEQKKIASILTSVDEVIENTQKQIDKLQDLKKATMNELLTKGIGHTEFKNSELGQIPKSWEIVKLDDITTKVVDGPHSTPEYLSSGIPFVTVKNIISGEIEFTNLKYISEADYEQFMHRGKPDVGDILYSKDGSIGYTAIVKSKNRFAYFVSVALIKIKHELVFSNFLNNALQSEYVWMQTKLMTEGSGLKHMVLKNIKALKIAMPSMLEQQKISHIIHSIDELIGRRKSKFLQIQSLKKSLMQDLLTGKVRVTVN